MKARLELVATTLSALVHYCRDTGQALELY